MSSYSTNRVIVIDNDDGGDDDDDNGDDGLIHQHALKTDWGEPSECFPHLLQIFRTCVRGTICNVKQLPGQLWVLQYVVSSLEPEHVPPKAS